MVGSLFIAGCLVLGQAAASDPLVEEDPHDPVLERERDDFAVAIEQLLDPPPAASGLVEHAGSERAAYEGAGSDGKKT